MADPNVNSIPQRASATYEGYAGGNRFSQIYTDQEYYHGFSGGELCYIPEADNASGMAWEGCIPIKIMRGQAFGRVKEPTARYNRIQTKGADLSSSCIVEPRSKYYLWCEAAKSITITRKEEMCVTVFRESAVPLFWFKTPALDARENEELTLSFTYYSGHCSTLTIMCSSTKEQSALKNSKTLEPLDLAKMPKSNQTDIEHMSPCLAIVTADEKVFEELRAFLPKFGFSSKVLCHHQCLFIKREHNIEWTVLLICYQFDMVTSLPRILQYSTEIVLLLSPTAATTAPLTPLQSLKMSDEYSLTFYSHQNRTVFKPTPNVSTRDYCAVDVKSQLILMATQGLNERIPTSAALVNLTVDFRSLLFTYIGEIFSQPCTNTQARQYYLLFKFDSTLEPTLVADSLLQYLDYATKQVAAKGCVAVFVSGGARLVFEVLLRIEHVQRLMAPHSKLKYVSVACLHEVELLFKHPNNHMYYDDLFNLLLRMQSDGVSRYSSTQLWQNEKMTTSANDQAEDRAESSALQNAESVTNSKGDKKESHQLAAQLTTSPVTPFAIKKQGMELVVNVSCTCITQLTFFQEYPVTAILKSPALKHGFPQSQEESTSPQYVRNKVEMIDKIAAVEEKEPVSVLQRDNTALGFCFVHHSISLSELRSKLIAEEVMTSNFVFLMNGIPLTAKQETLTQAKRIMFVHHNQLSLCTDWVMSSPIKKEEDERSEKSASRFRQRVKKECPTLPKVVCRIFILDQAIEEFVNRELLPDLIRKFILRQTQRPIQTLKEQKEYNLVDIIRINDEFGNWSFDVLFGMLKIILCLPDATFPSQWRLSEESTIEVEVAKEVKKEEEQSLLALPSLADWLEDVCDRADMTQFYEAWLAVLENSANVTTLQHLLDWKIQTWDRFNMAPNAKAILKEAVDQFKGRDTSAKGKQVTASKAEIEACVHKVKLFFYYHTGQADKVGRLSTEAVKLAFEEIAQSGYEAEGLFEQLKELLYTETFGSEDSVADPTELEARKSELGNELKELRRTYNGLLKQLDNVNAKGREMLELAELQDEVDLQDKTAKLDICKQGLFTNMDQSATVLKEDVKRYRGEVVRRTYHTEEYQHLLKRANELSIQIQTCERSIVYNDSLLSAKHKARRELLKKYRGIIFYGPPGTGKTRIMAELQTRVGLTSVAPPLAAAEVTYSYVGQTERILLDIAYRARKVPHLLCVVSIDEIDSLARKRDEKASQHKVDSLSVLLSIIEGIKDVPNLIFLAATNRIKMMDEAFLRRMSGQFFVGRPSATVRYRILKDVNFVGRGTLINEEIMELTMVLTTNFTGAAMVQLRSNIIVFAVMNNLKEVTAAQMVNQCRATAKQFSISFGGITLPDLFLDEGSRTVLSNQAKNKNGHVFDIDFTGRMHVDLNKKQIHIERAKGVPPKMTALSGLENRLHLVLPRLVQYAFDRKIDFVQVFDIDWIVSNTAYDDSKMIEILIECISECREYSRAMMIFDLDSLVGVNNNQSNSNMGLSTSYSINNHKLFSYIVDIAKKARFVHNDNKREELWVVTVATHPFLSKSFKESVLFTPTEEETQEALLEEEKATKPRKCFKCDEFYLEAENKLNSCTYHDGFLFDSGSNEKTWKPLPRHEVERFVDKSKFLWSCCTRPMHESGCKKGSHGIEIPPDQTPEDYLYRLAVDKYNHRFMQFKLTTWTANKNEKKK